MVEHNPTNEDPKDRPKWQGLSGKADPGVGRLVARARQKKKVIKTQNFKTGCYIMLPCAHKSIFCLKIKSLKMHLRYN